MSQHEKGLLIVGLTFLIVIFWGAFLGSQILEVSLLVVLRSALKSFWWGLALMFFVALASGLRYELTTNDQNLRIIEARFGRNKNYFDYRAVIFGGVCLFMLALLLSVPPYLLGYEDFALDVCYYLMIIGTIFLFLIVWMFVGAVIARIRRS